MKVLLGILLMCILALGSLAIAFLIGYRYRPGNNVQISGIHLKTLADLASIVLSIVSLVSIYFLYQSQVTLAKQNTYLYVQRFEDTFFNMLSNLKDEISGLRIDRIKSHHVDGSPEIESLSGVAAFRGIDNIIYNRDYGIQSLDDAKSSYFYSELQMIFEPYNVQLAILLQYVDDSDLSKEEKEKYFNLVLQPMSLDQKKLVVYHIALSDESRNPFNKVIKDLERKHRFFKDLSAQDRIIASFDHSILIKAGIHCEEAGAIP